MPSPPPQHKILPPPLSLDDEYKHLALVGLDYCCFKCLSTDSALQLDCTSHLWDVLNYSDLLPLIQVYKFSVTSVSCEILVSKRVGCTLHLKSITGSFVKTVMVGVYLRPSQLLTETSPWKF